MSGTFSLLPVFRKYIIIDISMDLFFFFFEHVKALYIKQVLYIYKFISFNSRKLFWIIICWFHWLHFLWDFFYLGIGLLRLLIFSFLFLSFYSVIWKVAVFLFSSLSSEFYKFLLASFLNSKISLRKIMNTPPPFLNSVLTLPHAYNIHYLMMIFHTISSFWNPLKGWCLWSSLVLNFYDHLPFVRQSLLQNLS